MVGRTGRGGRAGTLTDETDVTAAFEKEHDRARMAGGEESVNNKRQ